MTGLILKELSIRTSREANAFLEVQDYSSKYIDQNRENYIHTLIM